MFHFQIHEFLDDVKVAVFEVLGASKWVRSEDTRDAMRDHFENFTIHIDGQDWIKMGNESKDIFYEMYNEV